MGRDSATAMIMISEAFCTKALGFYDTIVATYEASRVYYSNRHVTRYQC